MTVNTYQPDATVGKDTYLDSVNAASNYGTTDPLRTGRQQVSRATVGTMRSILEFDISDITAGSTVSTAILTLTVAASPLSAFAGTVYRMTQSTWVEAQATWNIYKTANNWTSAGGDYDGASGVACTFPASGSFTVDIATLAQDAVTSRSGILRILLKKDDETSVANEYLYFSSDNATAGNRPKLDVTFTAGGGGATLRRLSLLGVG